MWMTWTCQISMRAHRTWPQKVRMTRPRTVAQYRTPRATAAAIPMMKSFQKPLNELQKPLNELPEQETTKIRIEFGGIAGQGQAWHLDHAHEFQQACVRHTEAFVGQVVVYADEAWPAKTAHKANLEATQEVPMTADAKRILQDLGNLPKFQFFYKIKRSGHLARDRWGVDCSEVHPPPRVMKLVADVGLQAVCALDFTTMDEDGDPQRGR